MSVPMDPTERLRMLVTAAVLAGGGQPEDVDAALEGFVWLGDLSGMEVVPTVTDVIAERTGLHIAHRCGTTWDLPRMEGLTADGSAMLGNLVEAAVEAREGHACPPHNPSPEHRARVAAWAAAAGHQPARAGHLEGASEEQTREVLGDDATNQLDVVRALSSGARYVDQSSAAPRLVDGPGCTPAVVAGSLDSPAVPFAPIGALRAVYDEIHQTTSTGHGPEDYPERAYVEEPADIPVRRCIDGKWQTVEVTMSDFRANEGADGRQPFRVKPDPEPSGPYCGCADPECPNPHDGQYTHG